MQEKILRKSIPMNQKRSETFDRIATLYDAIRPDYPAALVADVIELASLNARSTILEIGAGTGKATLPFAEKGYTIHCLEPGKNLATVAAKNLELFPAVTLEHVKFEDWQTQTAAFDLVMSAQAFHWIPAAIAYPKVATALKKSGRIALFWNLAADLEDEVLHQLDRAHQQFTNFALKPIRQQREQQERELLHSGLFADIEIREYTRSIRYSTQQYLDLLRTQSDYLVLSSDRQQHLETEIAAIIDDNGGSIVKPYTTLLIVARPI
jgi:protein-L-isoaspartate O-methyltransferase